MIQSIQQTHGISIRTEEDRELFFFSTDPRFRTHIHPLNVPGTEYAMTRFRPADHPWQYGIFCGLNKVNGLDFWCCGDANYPAEIRGIMQNRDVVDSGQIDEGITFTALNDWSGPNGELVLEERQKIVVPDQEVENSYVFDLQWELKATQVDIHIEQSDYGGFSARLVGTRQTKRHANSQGQVGDDCADHAANWVSVAQPVDGVGTYSKETRATFAYAGLAIFDHPQNLCYPNKWRVDGDGMINPAFALSQSVDLKRDASLISKYRMYVFKGLEDPTAIEREYKEWIGEEV